MESRRETKWQPSSWEADTSALIPILAHPWTQPGAAQDVSCPVGLPFPKPPSAPCWSSIFTHAVSRDSCFGSPRAWITITPIYEHLLCARYGWARRFPTLSWSHVSTLQEDSIVLILEKKNPRLRSVTRLPHVVRKKWMSKDLWWFKNTSTDFLVLHPSIDRASSPPPKGGCNWSLASRECRDGCRIWQRW